MSVAVLFLSIGEAGEARAGYAIDDSLLSPLGCGLITDPKTVGGRRPEEIDSAGLIAAFDARYRAPFGDASDACLLMRARMEAIEAYKSRAANGRRVLENERRALPSLRALLMRRLQRNNDVAQIQPVLQAAEMLAASSFPIDKPVGPASPPHLMLCADADACRRIFAAELEGAADPGRLAEIAAQWPAKNAQDVDLRSASAKTAESKLGGRTPARIRLLSNAAELRAAMLGLKRIAAARLDGSTQKPPAADSSAAYLAEKTIDHILSAPDIGVQGRLHSKDALLFAREISRWWLSVSEWRVADAVAAAHALDDIASQHEPWDLADENAGDVSGNEIAGDWADTLPDLLLHTGIAAGRKGMMAQSQDLMERAALRKARRSLVSVIVAGFEGAGKKDREEMSRRRDELMSALVLSNLAGEAGACRDGAANFEFKLKTLLDGKRAPAGCSP